jgi:predicted DNA-binding transcriptional regulator AlpA
MTNFATDEFLTRDELCSRLKISKKTLWTWERDKIAPPKVRIGGSVRYPARLLEQFLADRTTKG